MTRQAEEPQRRKSEHGGEEVTHPAFGQIGAHRVSGKAFLYGSDFEHHHYVMITIKRSSLNRGLSRDCPSEREQLIEVALSEAQWATFVSTMNMGGGAQCTIEHVAGRGYLPTIASAPMRKSEFRNEMRETLEDAQAHLNTLERLIKESKAPKAQKDEMWSELVRARNSLVANVTFVGNQFEEHMDTITGHAKTEINAHVQHVLLRAGVKALNAGGEADMPFSLPDDTTDHSGK